MFFNSFGLEKIGGNFYRELLSLGAVSVVIILGENGMGKFLVGYFEMLNVDLIDEFIEMIVV